MSVVGSLVQLSPILSPIRWYIVGWNRYAEFRGRSSRSEYWSFSLINLFANMTLSAFSNTLSTIFILVALLPSMAVFVRRLHDTGRSGWWVLAYGISLSFINIAVAVIENMDPLSIRLSPSYAARGFPWLFGILVGAVVVLVVSIFSLLKSDTETNKYGPPPKPLPALNPSPAKSQYPPEQ